MEATLEKTATDAFLDWMKDTTLLEKAKNIKPFGPSILIQVFYHFIPLETSLITTGKAEFETKFDKFTAVDLGDSPIPDKRSRLYPKAKVLAVGDVTDGYTALKPGHIVNIPDSITHNVFNEKWEEWRRRVQEDPEYGRRVPEPPMVTGAIESWDRYSYAIDKFKTDRDIAYAFTYMIPQIFAISIDSKSNG